MEECEICGKPTTMICLIELEGAKLRVDEGCAKGKKIIKIIDLNEKPRAPVVEISKEKEDEIVEGYGEVIRKARERLGLPLKVLAERINEKESVLIRIEKEGMLMSPELIKKLEKELGIKLTTLESEPKERIRIGKNDPFTLGDIAFEKKAKK